MGAAVLSLGVGVLAIAFAAVLARRALTANPGTERMREIQQAIQEGAQAFLVREYRVLAVFAAVLAGLLGVFVAWSTAAAFVLAATRSALTGYAGMAIAVRANARTAQAAAESLNRGLRVAQQRLGYGKRGGRRGAHRFKRRLAGHAPDRRRPNGRVHARGLLVRGQRDRPLCQGGWWHLYQSGRCEL
jgi:hypothetical protein